MPCAVCPTPQVPGDPRRPNEVKKYEAPVYDADKETSEAPLTLVSMICGVAGLMFKVKLASWASLLLSLAVLNRMRHDAIDAKQIMSTLT